jgi:putative holliday junction resolvase
MRVLGLDLGSKTLGISMSDLTQTVATTYTTLRFENQNYEPVFKELKNIIEEHRIETLVLGLPKNMNNSIGPSGENALSFQKLLQDRFNMEVVMQDERLSTKEATSYMIKADVSRKKRKEKIDSLAANIILQTYLDKKKGMK